MDAYSLAIYQEPLFWLFPVATTAISVLAFLLYALPLTALAYFDPPRLRKYKIQQKPFQVRRYFWPNVARICVNSSIMLLLIALLWPWLRQSSVHLGAMPAWYWVIAQLVLFTLLDDFLYYWMHRLLHVPRLMRHVHSVHHRIKNTCAMDGNYFHWLEFVLTGTLSLVGPLLLGAHVYVVWIWIVIRQFEAADGHCGYDLPYNPMRLFPLYKGPIYHDFHHARFNGNYAGFLPYLDGLMGTYIKDYLAFVAQRKKPPARAAIVREIDR
jgi:4-alpha-methyl-delta7-sterol-4alpha-methyl oxidase